MKKHRSRSGSRSGSSTSSSIGSGLGVNDHGSLGSKKFKGVAKMRRNYRRHPRRLIRKYVDRARTKVGVTTDRQVWSLTDYSRKLLPAFQRCRGMWKVHFHCSSVLQLLLSSQTEHAAAYLAQVLKSLHQQALDQGRWHNASHLLPVKDPLAREDFGGDLEELDAIATFQAAVTHLRGAGARLPGGAPRQTGGVEEQGGEPVEESGNPEGEGSEKKKWKPKRKGR